MLYSTLITIKDISANLGNPDWAIFDCHFLLDDAEAGRRTYLKAHIPGATYVHLDKDLSGKVIPGKTGRPHLNRLSYLLLPWKKFPFYQSNPHQPYYEFLNIE